MDDAGVPVDESDFGVVSTPPQSVNTNSHNTINSNVQSSI